MTDLNIKNTTKLYHMDGISSFGKKKNKERIRCIFENYFSDLKKTSLILEIGPGRGEFAEEAIERGYEYVGIEPSIALSNDLHTKGIRVINQSVPSIDFKDNSFDLVYSFDVLEHLKGYSEALQFIQESVRVVKTGGIVCVIAPNFTTLGPMFFEYEYQHTYITTFERIENMFLDAGLTICRRDAFMVKPNKGFLLFIDRIMAYTLIPLVRNPLLTASFNIFGQRRLLFKVRKNIYDHIVIIGRKPLNVDK